MAKVLYITVNPKSVEESFSHQLGTAFLEKYQAINPQDEVVELDLYKENVPYIDEDVFSGWGKLAKGEELTSVEAAKVTRMGELVDQFISFDKYVFVTPFWNFSFPARLKTYIDTISIAGKTFRYTENGPEGLLKGKKMIHLQSRGGYYSQAPMTEFEFGDRYLRTIAGFFGITDYAHVYVEGHNAEPNKAQEILAKGIEDAKAAAEKF